MAVVESKFMWIGRDGKIHYITKEDYDNFVATTEKIVNKVMLGAVVVIAFNNFGGVVYAATGAPNKVMVGLKPLINLITDAAEPVSYGYMVKGFLKITQGKEEEGKKVIGNAAKGYLGVKFIPQIIGFLGGLDLFS